MMIVTSTERVRPSKRSRLSPWRNTAAKSRNAARGLEVGGKMAMPAKIGRGGDDRQPRPICVTPKFQALPSSNLSVMVVVEGTAFVPSIAGW